MNRDADRTARAGDEPLIGPGAVERCTADLTTRATHAVIRPGQIELGASRRKPDTCTADSQNSTRNAVARLIQRTDRNDATPFDLKDSP